MIEKQKGENMSENMFVAQIKKGTYRNEKVKGIFPVVSELKQAKDGSWFITVNAQEANLRTPNQG